MRDSFVFYRSFAESVKNLPPEEYKKVMYNCVAWMPLPKPYKEKAE